jgi:hypothetical protein
MLQVKPKIMKLVFIEHAAMSCWSTDSYPREKVINTRVFIQKNKPLMLHKVEVQSDLL